MPRAKEGGLGLGRLSQWKEKPPYLLHKPFSWSNPRKKRTRDLCAFSLPTGSRDSWESRNGFQVLFFQHGLSKGKMMGVGMGMVVMEVSIIKGTLPFVVGRGCSRRALRYGASSRASWCRTGKPLHAERFSLASLRYYQVLVTYQQRMHKGTICSAAIYQKAHYKRACDETQDTHLCLCMPRTHIDCPRVA